MRLETKPLQIRLRGRSLILREATIADAAFIVALRCDPQLSRFIKRTDPSVAAQEVWLREYPLRPDDYLFVCDDLSGKSWGTMHIACVHGTAFDPGSWIFRADAPVGASVEAFLLVCRFGFDRLGCDMATFYVRRANEHVWRFHESCGAIRSHEDADYFYYSLDHIAFIGAWSRYRRIVSCPNPLDWIEPICCAK